MTRIQQISRSLFLITFSLFLTAYTGVFGTIPLMWLRNTQGRLDFYIGGLLGLSTFVILGIPMVWLPFFVVFTMVAFFTEDYEHHKSLVRAGSIAIFGAIGAGLFATGAWLKLQNMTLAQLLDLFRNNVTELSKLLPTNMELPIETLIQQLPSALMIMLVFGLWLAVLSQAWFVKRRYAKEILKFRIPEFSIWLFIGALAGAFLAKTHPVYPWAVNMLNFMVFLFFLQGLSVVAAYFASQKTGLFWRCIWYGLLVGQLFIFVSFLGLIDFWLNIRQRISKKTMETI